MRIDDSQYRQSRLGEGANPVAQHAGYLMITEAPAGSEALEGRRLLGAGALPAGAYRCEIDITGWEGAFDVVLKPSAVSGGTFAPLVALLLLDRVTAKTTVAGTDFATGTAQTITCPASGTLHGETRAVVTFTVPAAETITFSVAAGLAEFSGGGLGTSAGSTAGSGFLGATGGVTTFVADEFERPADTTAYAAGDGVAAATTDTGTTPLRALTNLARVAAGSGYITRIRLWTDQAANVAGFRIHFYKVAAPTTAVVGDNAQMTLKYTNFLERVGSVDLPAMKTSTVATNSTAAETSDSALRLAFACAAGSRHLYYRIETLSIFTPASGQKFYLEVGAENN